MRLSLGRLVALVVMAIVVSAAPAFPQTPAGKPTVKRVPAPNTSAGSGQEMFKAYCTACHGPEGKGNGPAAVGLKKAPRDLTQLTKDNGGKFPRQRFEEVVGQNALVIEHGTSEMPMWGTWFRQMKGSDQLRVYNLMTYVESLQAK
jgi:mono/diheme cytochrome c family protein